MKFATMIAMVLACAAPPADFEEYMEVEEPEIEYIYSAEQKPTSEVMAEPEIDGALVGGASLDPASFATIVRHAAALPAPRVPDSAA